MATTSFTTNSTTQDPSGGQRLVPSPLGRLMVTEAGDPFFTVGDHLGISWAYTRQLFPGDVWDSSNGVYQNFAQNTPVEGDYTAFFDMLQAQGINTMRVFLEQQATNADGNPSLPDDPAGTYWLESDAGAYSADMHAFLDNLLALADARGIYLILSPFSTYYYRDAFGTEGPWATRFGGPLTDIDDFFQSPQTLSIAKDRMREVTSWVQVSPYADRVMGYEIINEWNAFRWTKNAEGDGASDRAAEVIRRAGWIGDLAEYTRTIDPQRLVINAPVVEDARGAIARSVFYSREFDVLAPHFYTLGNEEGINNPAGDRALLPAIEQARLTAYWMNLAGDRRPILNGEWGPVRSLWPGGSTYYSDQTYKSGAFGPSSGVYTLAEDEQLYSAVIWSAIAAGQFGTPLRMGSDLLNFVTGINENGRTLTQGFLLSDGMRDTQYLVSAWWAQSAIDFDWSTYSPDPSPADSPPTPPPASRSTPSAPPTAPRESPMSSRTATPRAGP
ncbi:MAG: cellulase family glycosylhydrolase [Phycisphaerales bacterium]|nr:cellulase family glycosylhydrolase [Phycisphaerales bacterium]